MRSSAVPSGRRKSSTVTSGPNERKSVFAPAQSSASSTSKPRDFRNRRMPKRGPASSSTRRTLLRSIFSLFPRTDGQADLDDGAAILAVAHGDAAAMIADDAAHDRQSEAGAAAATREERREEARQIVVAEPRTRIRDRADELMRGRVFPRVDGHRRSSGREGDG